MNDLPRRILIDIIAQYGPGLVDEPRRLEGLLKDLCGEHQREIKALMIVAREHIPQDLRSTTAASLPPEVLVANLTQRLLDNFPIDEEMGRWAVESWAAALGIVLQPTLPDAAEQARLEEQRRRAAELHAQREAEALAAEQARLVEQRRRDVEAQARRQAADLAAEQARLDEQRRRAAELQVQRRADDLDAEQARMDEQRRRAAELQAQRQADDLAAEQAWGKRERLANVKTGLPKKNSRLRTFGIGFIGPLVVLGLLALAGVFNLGPFANTPPATTAPTTVPTSTDVPTAEPVISVDPPACTTIRQTWTSPGDGMVLVCVPFGKFLMGAAEQDLEAYTDELPRHEVTLDAFWIDQTEITNALYQKCVQKGKCSAPVDTGSDSRENYYTNPEFSNYPVIHVTWFDAKGYCEWAGRSLPTEAQWELAARGTGGRLYPWGDTAPDPGLLNFAMKYEDTTQVGIFTPGASPYGALDMAGNVWEWVADWYGDYSASPATNPTGPAGGDLRVLRGGSWMISVPRMLRSTYRLMNYPDYQNYLVGFRCSR